MKLFIDFFSTKFFKAFITGKKPFLSSNLEIVVSIRSFLLDDLLFILILSFSSSYVGGMTMILFSGNLQIFKKYFLYNLKKK